MTDLLTSSEVAKRTGHSTESVRRWHRDGILPGFRIGARGHLKFRAEDVDALIEGAAGTNPEGNQ